MNPESLGKENIKCARDYLTALGDLVERFSTIKRVPRYTNGDRESDVEHSYHLALSATEIAANYFPELDAGLVTQFSLVHDLPEVYTGDVPTMNISSHGRLKKEEAEQVAIERLINELPPYMSDLLVRYEQQVEPEARFVRYLDKIMPGIMNMVGQEVSTFLEDNHVNGLDEFDRIIVSNQERLKQMFPELPFVSDLMRLVEFDLRDVFLDKLK